MFRQKRALPALAAAICLLLGACGAQAPKAYDPAATAGVLMESGAFSNALEELDQDVVADYYHLDGETLTGCAAYTSLSAGAEEIVVLTLSGEEAAKTALEALRGHVEDQKAALKDYQPGEVSKLDGAILDQRGASVLLVVAADKDAAQTALDGLDK